MQSTNRTLEVSYRPAVESRWLHAQRLESLGTLTGGVVHDLNNLLTPILICGELLKQGHCDAARLCDVIVTSADRGAKMIANLLAFAGGEKSQRELIDLRDLLRDTEMILTLGLSKSINIDIHAPAGLDKICADKTQLSQVLLNLAFNARDAMPQGGQLRIELENFKVSSSFAAKHKNLRAGPHLLLKVSDTGEGIPKSVINHIFDPFFTTKPPGKGTGLGLSTAIGIIRSHGGNIAVRSEPGKGATFSVYLPSIPSKVRNPLQEVSHVKALSD